MIGNPPYNELRDLDEDNQRLYKESPYYTFAKGGRVNMFQFFYPLGSSILTDNGICSMITQNSLLAEDSANGNRKLILSKFRILGIDSFPERDNIKLRVFESAKMSVCICFLQNNSRIQDDYFPIRVWKDKFMAKGHSLLLSKKDIYNVYPDDLIIPICDSTRWQLLLKLKNHSDFSIIAQAGEIDMTKFKSKFSQITGSHMRRVITGAQVLRYEITDTPSQGSIAYLNRNEIKLSSDRELAITKNRIVMQRITGVDSSIRIISTLAPADIYCANSTNYISGSKNKIDLRYLLGILNSKCINFFFKQTSTNTNVTSKEIAKLPIPNASISIRNEIIYMVDKIISLKKENSLSDTSVEEYKIECLVYKLFELTVPEIKIIESN